MKHLNLFLLFLLCSVTLPAAAQIRNINLTIGVTGPGDIPLPNANVTLMHTDYALSYGTISLNANGECTIKVYPGNHRIEASMAGYNPASTEFMAVTDTTVILQLSEENTLPFSLQTTVQHNSETGLNNVTLSWNKEEPVFYDSFEDYDAFAIEFGQWTGIDGDGLMTAPLEGNYVNRGVMQYAQIMNPMAVVPAWWYDYPILRPYNGQQYVGFTRTYSGQANDDWLISPPITPGNKNVLAFMAKAGDRFREKFQVFITEQIDNPNKNDFTMLNAGNYETADYTGWREFCYDLSNYAGKTVKFAIRYIGEAANGGAFMLMIDDVYVGQDQSVFRKSKRTKRVLRSPMNPNESFNVFLNGNLAGSTDGYEYLFTDLTAGTYVMGVQAVYPSSQTDVVETTLTLLDDNAKVTVNVSTNNGQSVNGQFVELTDIATTQTYSATVDNGQAVFNSIPHGHYLLGMTVEHYDVYDSEIDINDNSTISIILKETIVDPYNITADLSDDNVVTVKWNQTISFVDSFEDYDDFATLSFGDWRTYDLDKHPVYPIALGAITNIISFPGSGTANNPTAIPPMVFNPWHTTPPMMPTDPAVQAPTGDKTIIFFSAQMNGSNKWLISPELTIRDNFVCRFTAKAYDQYPEIMEVCVFTDGSNPNVDNYEPVSSINPVSTGQWTIYETDLSQYAGQKVHIGVHYMSFDAFFAQIDDFYVGTGDDEGTLIDVGYIDHYEIYLDGMLHGTSVEPIYVFNNLAPGIHTVGIKAIYASGASQLSEYEFEVTGQGFVTGDINGDGIVDVEDVNATINIILKLNTSNDYPGNADLDGSGIIDVEDVNALINIILKLT